MAEEEQETVSERCKQSAHDMITKLKRSDADEAVKWALALNNLSSAAERFSKIKGGGWSGADGWRTEEGGDDDTPGFRP